MAKVVEIGQGERLPRGERGEGAFLIIAVGGHFGKN